MIYKILGQGETKSNCLEVDWHKGSIGLTMKDEDGGLLLFMEVSSDDWDDLMDLIGYEQK